MFCTPHTKHIKIIQTIKIRMGKLLRYKKIIISIIVLCLALVLSGCVSGEVSFNGDGSGSATITVQKDGALTREKFDEQIDAILSGVTLQSKQSGKVRIGKIRETDSAFVVELKFRRISELNGLGYYRFSSGSDFGLQRTERALFGNFEKGKFSLKGTNYNNSTYTIRDDAVNKVGSVGVAEGLDASSDALNDAVHELYTADNTFFVFMICGFDNVTDITFNVPGKILVHSDKNVTVQGENSIRVTPFEVRADILGTLEDGVTSFKEDNVPASAFIGYVVFENAANYTLPIVLGVIGLLLAVGIVVGIFTGFFKKVVRSKKFKLVIKHKVLYLFVLPGFVLMLIFNYLPMAGIIVAFKNYTVDGGVFGSEWAGLTHFITLITHPGSEFWLIFRNTVVMAFLKLIFGFPSSILLALMFNALSHKIFKRVVQTVSYLPYFVSWVVVSNLCYILLTTNGGIINNVLAAFNISEVKFYSEPGYWWGILTVTSVWKNLGWGTIVYLAAITGISPDHYEAASIDGANGWQKLWNVTIPGMMPVISIQLILSMGALIKDDFDQIFTMVGGTNYSLRKTTEVFSSLVYRQLRSGVAGFSSATAVSLVQSVISLVLVLFTNRLVRKSDNQGLW